MILSMPWIVIALVAYNTIVFMFGTDPFAPAEAFKTDIFSIPMPSGASWTATRGDLVLAIALLALFIEVMKATRIDNKAILDHVLSVLVFVVCIVEFLIVPEAATSLFVAITLIAVIDVLAGFVISLASARRDVSLGGEI